MRRIAHSRPMPPGPSRRPNFNKPDPDGPGPQGGGRKVPVPKKLAQLERRLAALEEANHTRDGRIAELEEAGRAKDETIEALQGEVAALRENAVTRDQLRDELADFDRTLGELNGQVESLSGQVDRVLEQYGQIAELFEGAATSEELNTLETKVHEWLARVDEAVGKRIEALEAKAPGIFRQLALDQVGTFVGQIKAQLGQELPTLVSTMTQLSTAQGLVRECQQALQQLRGELQKLRGRVNEMGFDVERDSNAIGKLERALDVIRRRSQTPPTTQSGVPAAQAPQRTAPQTTHTGTPPSVPAEEHVEELDDADLVEVEEPKPASSPQAPARPRGR